MKHDLVAGIEQTARKSLTEIDSNRVLSDTRIDHYKRTPQSKTICFLNSFLDFCHRNRFGLGIIKVRPIQVVPKNLPKYVPFEMIQSSLGLIDRSDWIGLRDYALILFLYATGAVSVSV